MSVEIFVRSPMSAASVDQALKLLRRQMMREGVFRILQNHKFFVKPGDKRRLKIARAESRRNKRTRMIEKRTKVIEDRIKGRGA